MTLEILRERQAWPLEQKIDHTVGAIDALLSYCKEHDRAPYVSFSGGLNSTVLLYIARRVFGADCWEYIHKYDIPYCEIYDVPGIDRTGCVFCGFGAQFNSSRFRILYKRYPKLYCMAMNYTNNGYTLRHALRRMGVMLPDE